MIYGLYVSATGVLANSYRQDVIANNLANIETVGFKKDLARFVELRTAASQRGLMQHSNPLLEDLGGGLSIGPTELDLSQGDLEFTGAGTDAAIQGEGFFAVNDGGRTMLTRDGRMFVNREGNLALINGGQEVLDENLKKIPVVMDMPVQIDANGIVMQKGLALGRIGVFDVPDRALLVKQGKLMFEYANLEKQIRPGTGVIRGGTLERANVDPASALAELMAAQRELEANANMIRFHDQTLGRLVNDVGKIG